MSDSLVNRFPRSSERQNYGRESLDARWSSTSEDIASGLDSADPARLNCKLQASDEIALAIESFPLLYRQTKGMLHTLKGSILNGLSL